MPSQGRVGGVEPEESGVGFGKPSGQEQTRSFPGQCTEQLRLSCVLYKIHKAVAKTARDHPAILTKIENEAKFYFYIISIS